MESELSPANWVIPAGGAAVDPEAAPGGAPRRRRWKAYVSPGQPVTPLTRNQKLRFWLHLEVTSYSPLPTFFGSGYEQLIDGDPKFGTDSGAFGERLGAGFLRDATMRFFVSSAFPAMLHEDPRYYRKASGPIVPRGLWAGEQALVTQTDSGRRTINYSDILGHLAACALTPAYYPPQSANGRVVVEAWLTSIAGDAGNNLFLEFWPSVRNRWRQHRRRIPEQRRIRGPSSKEPHSPSIP